MATKNSGPYEQLLDENRRGTTYRRPTRAVLVWVAAAVLAVVLFVALVLVVRSGGGGGGGAQPTCFSSTDNEKVVVHKSSAGKLTRLAARGVREGVSAKSAGHMLNGAADDSFNWTNRMLTWQRTAFHFQPVKNWMNDPNGPLLYKGWYHLFYQYNPKGAVWGNIVWGHAISQDLINWRHLPIAMVPDKWYDAAGVWTGSATILPDGQVVMLYTGSTNQSVQLQNLAYPSDPNDPFLTNWTKYSGNPVLSPPPGIYFKDFRDPTTAWSTRDGKWRITIGSKVNKTGISLVYDTVDFKNYELLDGVLHAVEGTGMWECVDFYPVSAVTEHGLDTSVNGPTVRHVVKASMDDDRNDYYAIGTYHERMGKWVPDDPRVDVGIGLRYDYGIFYASKTFYDQDTSRRILWGWIKETDSEKADVAKGWSSVMSLPRTVLLDRKTGSNLIQWPVEEVEKLRTNEKKFEKVKVKPGSVVPLDVGCANQLDIVAEFELDEEAQNKAKGPIDEGYICSGSKGAAQMGALGPFGLLVLADGNRTEQTAVYFYIARGKNGNFQTHFCSDQTRSSIANDVEKKIYGNYVPVLGGEELTMRILVDHSIVESFAQEGRTCITSRVYPTRGVYQETKLFLFNNATRGSVSATIKVWQMTAAEIKV